MASEETAETLATEAFGDTIEIAVDDDVGEEVVEVEVLAVVVVVAAEVVVVVVEDAVNAFVVDTGLLTETDETAYEEEVGDD